MILPPPCFTGFLNLKYFCCPDNLMCGFVIFSILYLGTVVLIVPKLCCSYNRSLWFGFVPGQALLYCLTVWYLTGSRRSVYIQSTLKRRPGYRTLERDLIQLQQQQLFQIFVVVSLRKASLGNTYSPEITQQFPKMVRRSFYSSMIYFVRNENNFTLIGFLLNVFNSFMLAFWFHVGISN